MHCITLIQRLRMVERELPFYSSNARGAYDGDDGHAGSAAGAGKDVDRVDLGRQPGPGSSGAEGVDLKVVRGIGRGWVCGNLRVAVSQALDQARSCRSRRLRPTSCALACRGGHRGTDASCSRREHAGGPEAAAVQEAPAAHGGLRVPAADRVAPWEHDRSALCFPSLQPHLCCSPPADLRHV